jgi:hypothetical protein
MANQGYFISPHSNNNGISMTSLNINDMHDINFRIEFIHSVIENMYTTMLLNLENNCIKMDNFNFIDSKKKCLDYINFVKVIFKSTINNLYDVLNSTMVLEDKYIQIMQIFRCYQNNIKIPYVMLFPNRNDNNMNNVCYRLIILGINDIDKKFDICFSI